MIADLQSRGTVQLRLQLVDTDHTSDCVVELKLVPIDFQGDLMRFVVYYRVRDSYLPSILEQCDSLPQGEILSEFYEEEPSEDRPKLKLAINAAQRLNVILAIPAMFRDRATLELLKQSDVSIWPDINKALRQNEKRNQKQQQGLQRAKSNGVKMGAARADFNPAWRNTAKAAAVSASRRSAQAMQYYHVMLPTIEKLRSKGLSLQNIAQHLNDSGYTTSTGYPFSASSVLRVLRRISKDS